MRDLTVRVTRRDQLREFEVDYRELTCSVVVQNVAGCLILMTNTELLEVRENQIQFLFRYTLDRFPSVRHDNGERRSINTDKFRDKGAAFIVQITQDSNFIPESNLSFWTCECLSNVAVSGSKHERSLGIF